jgi:hypothetical protein
MRRALIVGIDDYPSCPLQGCVLDAERLAKVLQRHHNGQLNFQCDVLTSRSQAVTRPILRKRIGDLFGQPADVAFLHFSGHGTSNNLGGYLVTPDFTEYDVGIPMSEILGLANQTQVREVFITLDCCHSGHFGNMPSFGIDKVVLSAGVSVITATRSGQEAIEVGGGGVFSSLLAEALDGGAAGLLGDVSAASVYAYVDSALGAWDQRPLFKANVDRFAILRNAAPKISPDILRKLPEYFPLPAEELPLSPAHEPSETPRDEAKERIFRDLIKLRHVGLVEPVGEEHMYHAAVRSKSCALTKLGSYYWRLVNENKI